MKQIIKKILYQKLYSRYKEIFEIDIDEIIEIGIKKFIQILKDISINESKYKIKYFRLDNIEYDDYFSVNKGKIIIGINNIENIEAKIKTIKILVLTNVEFKLLYKIETNKKYFENDFYKYISQNIIFSIFISSKYNKYDYNFLLKNSNKFNDKEIYIGLDKLKNQSDVENEIIFEIIEIIKNAGGHINNDLIRLESAFKKIYILGPKELHLDLYEYCNASCNFCVTNGPGFLTDRIDNNENNYKIQYKGIDLIKLFKKIKKSQTESLALGITGEPFLHPEIKYILTELCNINIKVGFLTNGYKLLENLELILKNKNVIHFYINISAGNIESFKNTRPNDNFYNFLNVWKAIKIIRKKRPDIIIRTLYVITPQNINGLDDFIDLCIKNNVGEIEYKRVVPYIFSNKDLFFNDSEVLKIINLIKSNQEKISKINNNSEYIINEFNEILEGKTVQYPEDDEMDKSNLVGKTNNCYNPYFYISIFRSSSYTCGKFVAKLGTLSNIDLYENLFEIKNTKNILDTSENIKKYLGENKWKEKCSRCHHLDVINIVKQYIDIKKISLKN
ncbi:MAG: radical SAM protein [Candidatus Gracilibacteria bacterium]|nr:radical SAM protein [Candidatus Gracilibacteria bacterium]